MQRWPAVPTAAKTTPEGPGRGRPRGDDHGVVAAEFEERPAQPPADDLGRRGRPIRQLPVAEISGSRASVGHPLADVFGLADAELEDARGSRSASATSRDDLLHGQGRQRASRGEGFQTTVSPQTAATAAFQAQTATGKLKAVMIADRPERVPLLDHPVPGPLAGDRQAVKLPRQPDGEVAHVDHLLDLALPLGADLARLQGDEQAQVGLVLAERLADPPDDLASSAGRGPSASAEGRDAHASAIRS